MFTGRSSKKAEEKCEVSLTAVRENFEAFMAEPRYQTLPLLCVLQSTLDMLGNTGAAWKFALQDIAKGIKEWEDDYKKVEEEMKERIKEEDPEGELEPSEHPNFTVQKMILHERNVLKQPKGKGTKAILEVLPMFDFIQSLFEELRYEESQFIYGEFSPTIQESLPNIPEDEFDEQEVEKEEKKKEKKKKGFLNTVSYGFLGNETRKKTRKCIYDAYLSSLAPKHTKSVRYMVWTASFSLPSRSYFQEQVLAISNDDSNREIESLLPLLKVIREELYLFVQERQEIERK